MIGIISLIHKHCNIFTKMEIIFLHLDISWIILFGEKGMHALLSFKGCELLALRLKLLFLRSLYDWMADATSFSFFNLLEFLELWNLGTRLLLGVSLACIPCARIVPLIALWKKKLLLIKKKWLTSILLLKLCIYLMQVISLMCLQVISEEEPFLIECGWWRKHISFFESEESQYYGFLIFHRT